MMLAAASQRINDGGSKMSMDQGNHSMMSHVQKYAPTEILRPLNNIEEKHVPTTFYISGDLSLLTNGRRVSVVGTRDPSPDGCARARALTKELVKNHITVVSGLAMGIDTIAHTTAIEAGGKTIAVMGTPLDKPYPEQNRGLFEKIAEQHLVISQFPTGATFQKKNFPIRNRTMALISDATVIIEAGEKSGTLHQGWEALRLGRLLFIMESVVNNPDLTWPKEMLSYGAVVLRRDNLSDVIENLPEFTARADIAF